MTTVNGNVVSGYPRISYSTIIAFDLHSKNPVAKAAGWSRRA